MESTKDKKRKVYGKRYKWIGYTKLYRKDKVMVFLKGRG